MDKYLAYYHRDHDAAHYAKLSAKTFFLYTFYLVCLFSIPAIQFLSAQITERDIGAAIIGETQITIEVVKNEELLQRGLSGRQSLPRNHGMLFVFPEDAYHGIWMKEMLIPLDVIWLNQYHEIVYIERNVTPATYPTIFRPNAKARYVLEMNAGFVDAHWLRVGDVMRAL